MRGAELQLANMRKISDCVYIAALLGALGCHQIKLYASVVVPPNPVRGAISWGQNSFMQV